MAPVCAGSPVCEIWVRHSMEQDCSHIACAEEFCVALSTWSDFVRKGRKPMHWNFVLRNRGDLRCIVRPAQIRLVKAEKLISANCRQPL